MRSLRKSAMSLLVAFFLLVCVGAAALPSRTIAHRVERVVVVAIVAAAVTAFQRSRTSESKLRALFASIDDAILVLDDEGTYVEIVRTKQRPYYRPPAELIGRRVAEVFPPEPAEFFLNHIRMALAERRTINVDYTLPIEGGLVWFAAAVSRLNASQVIWVARDITARKAAEQALVRANEELEKRIEQRTEELRRSEKRHRSIVEQAKDIIFTLDLEGTITSLNPAFERVLGWSVEEWLGRSYLDLVWPDERHRAQELFTHADRGLPPTHVDIQARDGSRVAVECSLVHQMVDGEAAGFLGFGRDVTDRRRAEQLLRESEERFQLLARATNNGVWDIDFVTGEVWRGDGFDTLFGYEQGQIAPTLEAWCELLHPQDEQRVRESIRTALETGQLSWSEEYRLRRGDGSYANVLDCGYIVRDAQKQPLRMVGAAMDLTERKQLDDQLAQAKRVSSLGRIAASIAHEFNNVLMGIQPNLEVVRRRGASDLHEPIDHILQAVRRGKRITDEILRYTRPAEPAVQCVDLASFFSTWEGETRSILGPNVTVSIDVAADVHIAADPHQIAQVITNLALNARDAMNGRAGELRIAADVAKSFGTFDFGVVRTPDQYVHIQVSDDGIGMTRDQLGHVFEPLFTTKPGGTGLGLAVSYQIVSRHSGKMFAQSEPGRGTTFHILLPAASPLVRIDHAASDVVVPPVRRILIVEDESYVAAGIRTLLELEGIQVAVVSTGAAAVPAIERNRPDAVVLDIGLPDVSGVDVYKRVAARWPDLPVLFSSGHADPAHLDEYLRKPNVGMLVKPYDFEVMMQTLTEVLGTNVLLRAAS
jgi:PAS domain S-box-containing protein